MSSNNPITRTCIKYWGGKQQLASRIIKNIPIHKSYIEPFFGGGAVFFAKSKSEIEIINDINDNMVNFYKVIKRNFPNLKEEIDVTLHSEWQYKQAKKIWEDGVSEEKIMRAWAVFLLSHQSFKGSFGKSWAYSGTRNLASTFTNMKNMFDERYVHRLEHVQIFSRDALNVIENTDGADSFFFLDPPYYNSNMGHYDGYTKDDFVNLLDLVSTLEGKFLLTTYPSEVLSQYTDANGWYTIDNEMHLSASNKKGKTKTEVFIMNYKIEGELDLFS